MSGFNYAMGMSNNAVSAYHSGLVPASRIKGIPSTLIKEYCFSNEWHHTSGRFFNETDFYNVDKVLATFGKIQHPDFKPNPKAIIAMKEYYRDVRKEKEIKVHKNCRVEWLEWGGTRKHPTCRKMTAENCLVIVKGKTAEVTTNEGKIFIKRLFTKGFKYSTVIVEYEGDDKNA